MTNHEKEKSESGANQKESDTVVDLGDDIQKMADEMGEIEIRQD